jgi:single-strand DNA-binding protein
MSLYANGIIRIISKPEARYFESGTMVVNFAAGIQEGKDKNGNYINNAIDVEVWGKTGQTIVDRCKVKDSIMVTGNIKRQEWQDKETGAKRSKHVLSVGRFEFLPRATSDESSPRAAAQPAAAPSSDEEAPF